jgi:hypothetical protein
MDFTVFTKFRPFLKTDKTKEQKPSVDFASSDKIVIKVIIFLKIYK